MENENYIVIDNLNKNFSGKNPLVVFKNFSLSIKQGEIHCIFGPNGCGKSTLLNILSCIDIDYRGKVLINNHPPKIGTVGFLFQDYGTSLYPWLTCGDNITLKYKFKGIKANEREKIAKELIKELNIDLNLDKYPYEFSGGQQQLISLARALCDSPNVLLMDEPFSALDAGMREKIRKEILSIIQKLKLTVVMVSHNLEDCIYCSDKITFLTNLPTKVFNTQKTQLNPDKLLRNIYSNEFSEVMKHFRIISQNAQNKQL
ncbi:MAG: ABC transporter ATP-binding protein [Bacteroidales bacterium]|jgi:NitT/TauT family transport system ATP-binding protein|nr:ABC transporter ATP-binding protein [Bacteroidales bacterium]